MTETTTRARPNITVPMAAEEQRAVAKVTAREAGGTKVLAFFEANKAKMAQMLPQHMTPDRFLRISMNALRTTPKLMDCTVESLFGATMFCAQVGLEPNTPQGHIYLIPFRNNRKNRTEVQVIIGYQGLIALARRSGQIESIMAQPVYANDEFRFDYMRSDDLSHRPKMDGPRGEFIGAWAMAKLKDGGIAFDFMPKSDIDKIRDGSQGYRTAVKFGSKDSPWIAHYDQMARKTAVRRLAKYLPMSIELAVTAQLDERDERRSGQGFHRLMMDAMEMQSFDVAAVGAENDEDEGAGDEPAPAVPDPSAQPHGQQQEAEKPRRQRRTTAADPTPAPEPGPAEDAGGGDDEGAADEAPPREDDDPAPSLNFGA